jgi:hypothetical protein
MKIGDYMWYEGKVWKIELMYLYTNPGFCSLRSVFNSANIYTPVKVADLIPCTKEVAEVWIASNNPEGRQLEEQ